MSTSRGGDIDESIRLAPVTGFGISKKRDPRISGPLAGYPIADRQEQQINGYSSQLADSEGTDCPFPLEPVMGKTY